MWDRLTTRLFLQPDHAAQPRVVDPEFPGPASGFHASEMYEQSIEGAKEGARLTSYSTDMYLWSSADDIWFVGRMELQGYVSLICIYKPAAYIWEVITFNASCS